MGTLARVPEPGPAPDRVRAAMRRIPRLKRRKRRFKHRYYAFLSYSHKDEEIAEWLHNELERFRVPRALAGRLTENGVIPRRLTPIFRDEHELAAADDLGEEIEGALASSQFLIVLCSPNAAKSHWTNAEIEVFKRARPDGCVLAAIISGEPFASEIPGREDEECFPPALRQRYDRRGRPTGQRVEPLAADLRDDGDSRRIGLLKLVAGMLGVGLDELVQREAHRRHRRLAYVAAASLGGMAVTSTLAVMAIQARDSARDQRREAEGLIGFMLGDLKDKLEPVGRLDALDGVGTRVLAYYQKQNKSELTDAALSQRSRALSLMGEVATLRGDLDTAQRLYKEAAEGTQEAVRRDPNDPQRLFEHAQNVYSFGVLASQRGQYDHAEAAFREYRRLADQMLAIQPDNLRWRMELQYAEANLGIVLLKQRRFAEAESQFEGALRTIEAVSAIDPKNADYRRSIPESLAWLADSELSLGKLPEAISHRQRQVALLAQFSQQSRGDVEFHQKLIPAQQKLGHLFAISGDRTRALAELQASVREADNLLPREPDNTKWLDYAASAKFELATQLARSGQVADARTQAESGCSVVGRLLKGDSSVVNWHKLLRICFLTRTEVALAAHSNDEALNSANRGLIVARSIRSGDRVADAFGVVTALRLIGDSRRAAGDPTAARAAWTEAASAIPADAAEMPEEMNEQAVVMSRLGRVAEYRRVTEELNRTGFRPTI